MYREFVVVGAHYDHLGTSPRFALDPDLVASTRPGADDNASGTAAVLELARRLAANPPARSVLLIHFDAEEWGLVGSRAFVQRPPVPLSAVVFMLNLDMVGRLNGRDLLIDGSVGDARPVTLADSVARAARRPGPVTPGSCGRSDHVVLRRRSDVPALSLTSGFHSDYHRVTHVPSRIDLPGLARSWTSPKGSCAPPRRAWLPRQTSRSPLGDAAARAAASRYHLRLAGHAWTIAHSGAVLSEEDEQRLLSEERADADGLALRPGATALARQPASSARRPLISALPRASSSSGPAWLPGIVAATYGADAPCRAIGSQGALTIGRMNAERNGARSIRHRLADWTAWAPTPSATTSFSAPT